MSVELLNYKARHYLHFDLPQSELAAGQVACDSSKVASHSFYPLLGYTIQTQKISKDEAGKIIYKDKDRKIKIAAHKDAAIYAHYAGLLSPLYENKLEVNGISDVVTAFRKTNPAKSNIQHAGEVFDYINSHRPCIVLAFDFEKFFDTLSHCLLKMRWCEVLNTPRLPQDHHALFKNLTNYSWVPRDEAYEQFSIKRSNPKAGGRRRICSSTDFRTQIRDKGILKKNETPGKGIPQGTPISALLSNIYLLEFDRILNGRITATGGLYRRYCDDFVVIIPPEQENEIEQLVLELVEAAELTVNCEKTERIHYPEGASTIANKLDEGYKCHLQYLGFTYDGARKLIRAGSLNNYYRKMRAGVRLARQTQRKYNRIEKGAGSPLSKLRKRKIYRQYSYLINRRARSNLNGRKGSGNFITYAYRAAHDLRAPEIKRQVRNHWKHLQKTINTTIKNQLNQG